MKKIQTRPRKEDGLIYSIESRYLQRAVPFLVAAPSGKPRTKFPAVFVLHGMARWQEFENTPMSRDFYEGIAKGRSAPKWVEGREVRTVSELADALGVVLVIANGGQGWYIDSPMLPDSQYESHLIRELVPWVDAHFPTRQGAASRALVGHSMGGFGAFRMLCKYPDLFCAAGVRSTSMGVCYAEQYKGNPIAARLAVNVFGDPSKNSKLRRAEDPLRLSSRLAGAGKGLFMSVGVKDNALLVGNNRRLHKKLLALDVPHHYEETPDGHEFSPYTDNMIAACARWMTQGRT